MMSEFLKTLKSNNFVCKNNNVKAFNKYRIH